LDVDKIEEDEEENREEGTSQGDCNDGLDNDDDGYIDCDDDGCDSKPACEAGNDDTGIIDTGGSDTDTEDTNTDTDTDTQDSDTDPSFEDNPIYIGGYNTDRCENGVNSTGLGIGDVSQDFELMDQYGEMVKLSDFCDNTVLLVSAAFW
jgi:hypothetical protein